MPEIRLEDTISAISTPPGEGGIGIVRLSGPEAIKIASQMFRKKKSAVLSPSTITLSGAKNLDPSSTKEMWRTQDDNGLENVPSHTIHFGTIVDQQENPVDEVLVSIFRKPKSYTAEDVVEISGHGGMRVLEKILALTFAFGARHAEPGEFTRRAFLNGRLDLTQAEAVLDLIRAKTDRSVALALKQLAGDLSHEIQSIKDELMNIYAHLEAYLDFPDEHLEIYSNEDFKSKFKSVSAKLKALILTLNQGEILREGASVVLCGRPNVGKSSLLNAFLNRDRALVSEVPGTTRDILEESVDLEGLWLRLIDTAGLGSSQHPLDQAAMQRTRRYLDEGDLFLWILDGSSEISKEDLNVFDSVKNKKAIAVINKIDLSNRMDIQELQKLIPAGQIYFVSAKTGEGISDLKRKISSSILEHELGQESALITRLRHKKALENSLESLERSFLAFTKNESLEFVALDLKQSLNSLAELVGEIYSEDLLDIIFREFCIGK